MPHRNSKIVRQFFPLVMAVAMALPGGPMSCCGSCGTGQRCADAGPKAGACCQQAGRCCGCCSHKAAAKSCCEKAVAGKSGQTGKVPCLCGSPIGQPADRPVISTLQVADEHFALPTALAEVQVGHSDRAHWEVASSPGELAPEIPHRILHCSWLN